jgi:hypothetical protein
MDEKSSKWMKNLNLKKSQYFFEKKWKKTWSLRSNFLELELELEHNFFLFKKKLEWKARLGTRFQVSFYVWNHN